MKVYIDLHIHSSLSPCSSNEMTPNNIVNMSILKGLDIIAITDHNSVLNCSPIMEIGKEKGIVVIPGMEVETKEEVHVVCLFPSLNKALKVQEVIWPLLPPMTNRKDIFGEQLLFDTKDEIIESVDKLLLTAADIELEDVDNLVRSVGGVIIPAHIDRKSYSVLSNMGFIPKNLKLKYLELSKSCNIDEFREQNKLDNYKFIVSSDAHDLKDISEREMFLELQDKSIEALFNELLCF